MGDHATKFLVLGALKENGTCRSQSAPIISASILLSVLHDRILHELRGFLIALWVCAAIELELRITF